MMSFIMFTKTKDAALLITLMTWDDSLYNIHLGTLIGMVKAQYGRKGHHSRFPKWPTVQGALVLTSPFQGPK